MTIRRLFFLLVCASPVVGGAATIYTDSAQFIAAASAAYSAPVLQVRLTDPGISVTTVSGMNGIHVPSWGHLENGVWEDCVGNCQISTGQLFYYSTTTWSFSKPLYAWGAYFDFSMDPFGAGLEIFPRTETMTIIDPPGNFDEAPLQSVFLGVVSNEPFSEVMVGGGRNLARWAGTSQFYTMSDLYIQDPPQVPEPASWGLVGLGAGFSMLLGKRRFTSYRLFSAIRSSNVRE